MNSILNQPNETVTDAVIEARLWAEAQNLCKRVPKLAPALERVQHLPARRIEAGFGGLVRIVVGQQVSVAAAKSINARVEAGLGLVSFETVLAHDPEALAGFGLSKPKVRTIIALADAVASGQLNFADVAGASDEEARASLCAVKGIGPWTADVYLLFALLRLNVWPSGDLALQKAAHELLNLRARPDAARMERLAKPWRPKRAVAARLLWAYYNKGASQPIAR